MASFDTLLVDIRHICDTASQEYGNCDAWDAVERLMLCSVDDPSDCSEELARYITTYHREGRWLADRAARIRCRCGEAEIGGDCGRGSAG